MSDIFNEIIFPSIEKKTIVYTNKNDYERIYCATHCKWISLVVCIDCVDSTKTLKEIMMEGIGCDNISCIY